MPEDPEPIDQNLLARLNALRPSTVTLTQSSSLSTHTPTAAIPDEEEASDLTARFAKLSGSSTRTADDANVWAEPKNPSEEATVPNAEDDLTLDELLADLGPDEAWGLEHDEQSQAVDLVRQAREALQKAQARDTVGADHDGNAEARHEPTQDQAGEQGAEQDDGGDAPPLTEDQEADEIIQRLLAEVSLDERYSDIPPSAGPQEAGEEGDTPADGESHGNDEQTAGDNEDGDEDDGVLVELPAAPTSLPSSTQPSDDALLPSAPDTLPSTRGSTIPGGNSSLQKFTDEEIETWCIICNNDATVRCLGCDGDLYCGNCWYEGHKSPDAGYEERSHKAVAFVKPGPEVKKAAKQKRRQLAT